MDYFKRVTFFSVLFLTLFFVLYSNSLVVFLAECYLIYQITKLTGKWGLKYFDSVAYLPDVKDKAVFITGCDTGFGHELACRLDKLGVVVYAGCLFPQGPGAQKLKEVSSDRIHVLQLDVTNDQHVQEAVKYVESSLKDKKLWAIVNNAGVIMYGDIELCSLKRVQALFDVNIMGVLRVTQAFLPFIRKSHGRVVIVSSLSGRITMSGIIAYSMSKHAAISLADGLRREMMKFNVSVHCIEPWFYRTNICEIDNILECWKNTWENTTETLREEYGKTYGRRCQKFLRKLQKIVIPESRLHEVTDDLVDSVIGKNPKIYYETGGGLLRIIYTSLPAFIVDWMMYLQMPS